MLICLVPRQGGSTGSIRNPGHSLPCGLQQPPSAQACWGAVYRYVSLIFRGLPLPREAWGPSCLPSHSETLSPGLLSEESDLARGYGPTKCSRNRRCLQALSAISTHASIVKETLPLLLQHLRQMNKGNYQEQSSGNWAEGGTIVGFGVDASKAVVPVVAIVGVTWELLKSAECVGLSPTDSASEEG